VLVNRRLRLLFVGTKFLFPLDEGGKIRTANILRRMKGGAFELVLASPAPGNGGAFADDIAALCDSFVAWPAPPRSPLRRLSALAGRLPVSVASDVSPAGRRAIAQSLETPPDLLVADFPHAAVLIPAPLPIPSVLFTHNVEAEILQRHARIARGVWRAVWSDQARKMRAFEGDALRRFDCVIAVSQRDAEALRRDYRLPVVEPIDTGVDLDYYAFSPPGAAPSPAASGGAIVFVGAMDWTANADAIAFLLDEIWPRITAARPQAQAVVVGRNPPASLLAKARRQGANFRFTGYVDDVRPYIAASHVSVIPLRVASGTRIKAFEAMALGRPVVSTPVGVEGLDIAAGEHYLAADNPADFAEAILRLLEDAGLRERLARAARAKLEERFSWAEVARQFEAICLRTVKAYAARRPPGQAASSARL
jgi:glycosyltransferase involved in cell wall biosynthesis